MTKKPYCKPHEAGLQSEAAAVAKRISRLFNALDTELNGFIVEGAVLKDIADFRYQLLQRLEADGWTLAYNDSDRLRVRQPGHKRPFPKRTEAM